MKQRQYKKQFDLIDLIKAQILDLDENTRELQNKVFHDIDSLKTKQDMIRQGFIKLIEEKIGLELRKAMQGKLAAAPKSSLFMKLNNTLPDVEEKERAAEEEAAQKTVAKSEQKVEEAGGLSLEQIYKNLILQPQEDTKQ